MMPDDERVPEIDPRVALAAERTVLAWFRTGITLMGFGFVVARFGVFLRELAGVHSSAPPASSSASAIGVLIVGAGVIVNFAASLRHHRMIRQLAAGEPFHASPRGPVALGVATGVGGIVLVAVLMSALLR
jgi:putative membrane protein